MPGGGRAVKKGSGPLISRKFVPLGGNGGEWLKKLQGGVRWLPLLKTSAGPGRVLSQGVIH